MIRVCPPGNSGATTEMNCKEADNITTGQNKAEAEQKKTRLWKPEKGECLTVD